MANIRETDLPGIGRKFSVETEESEKISIIVHEDGKREIFHNPPDSPEDYELVVTLGDVEARQIASIIGGMSYRPSGLEQAELSLSQLSIEWYKLKRNMDCLGKTIGDLAIRENTGTVVIASIESSRKQKISPGPEYVLQEGYTLVVAGERSGIQILKQLLERGSG